MGKLRLSQFLRVKFMEHYPKYYEQFRCIAAACQDSCCQQWQVDVDDISAEKYLQLEGPVGDHLRSVLTRTEDGWVLPITEGRCPMWRQDGLCEIQAAHGHEALCQTCQQFPRLRHEYEGFTELDLEMSCPEAARILFSGDEQWVGHIPATTDEILDILLRSRQQALEYLQGTAAPLTEKLIALLLYAHHVQSWIDGGEEPVIDPQAALSLAAALPGEGDITPVLEFYVNLEILTDRWRQRLNGANKVPVWDARLVRFVTYGIRRYWLQAVSDFDLLCRVKFLIGAVILLAHLGGDPVATAQLWSKEIENDPDNVEALLDGAYTSPAFTDVNLLKLLTP